MSRKTTRKIEALIFDLCETILRKADDIDYNAIDQYIMGLENEEISELNIYSDLGYRTFTRSIVQRKIFDYVDTYKNDNTGCSPFDFDSALNYQKYVDHFTQTYKAQNNSALPPNVFNYVFEYIKEASEHYRFLERFYRVREEDITNKIEYVMQNVAEDAAKTAAKTAVALSKSLANQAVESAEKAASEAETVAKRVAEEKATEKLNDVVNDKLKLIDKQISETSVAILGIFAGIVLAVVAGLFYSSSVLESINTANFYRLLCFASLVGFVCFHLIVAMFRFIAKIGGKDTNKFFSDGYVIFVSIVLLGLIIIGFLVQVYNPSEDCLTDSNNSNTDISISYNEVDTDIDTSESTTSETIPNLNQHP
ncbi:MAG: hypothetical protein IKY52_00280 [Clostridia bacterium]|nr:hypothetical protein [Clostridia bacterium]